MVVGGVISKPVAPVPVLGGLALTDSTPLGFHLACSYDAALEGGDLNTINFALQALYYRYTDAVGSEGEMIQGKASTAVDGFRSQQEVVRAMADPRYENDPAYRKDVYDKLERSNIQF